MLRSNRLPALLLGLILAACAGVKARETVLMPVMLQAWSTVLAKHVESVAATSAPEVATPLREKAEALRVALDSGDRYQALTVDWPTLRQAALAGVQLRVTANEIGPGVGLSIVETVNQFDQNWTKLGAR